MKVIVVLLIVLGILMQNSSVLSIDVVHTVSLTNVDNVPSTNVDNVPSTDVVDSVPLTDAVDSVSSTDDRNSVPSTSGNETAPSTDGYLLNLLRPLLHPVNLFDGPARISHAKTRPTKSKKPCLEQMMYYNYYAAAIYCQYQLIDLSCEYCKEFKNDVDKHEVIMNNVTDLTALVTLSHRRKEIVVTYRGLANVMQGILSALFLNKTRGNIKMHLGFYIGTMSLYDTVTRKVGYLLRCNPDYKIVLVGHSFGGAMARITLYFWLDLEQFPQTDYEIYTYGEPRVGNKAFADYFNKFNRQSVTSARIVNRADIIPHFPPTSSTLILGIPLLYDHYVHVQPEFWSYGTEGIFCDLNVYEDPKCSCSMGPLYSLLDHENYFGLNYLICAIAQPVPLAALPLNILQPVGLIPPLPTPIPGLLGGVTVVAGKLLFPILGR